MRKIPLIVLVLAFALIAAACGSDSDDTTTTAAAVEETTTTTEAATTTTAAPETTTTEAMDDIGNADNPIKVLFFPSVSAEEIIAGCEILKGVLEEATGLVYEVSVPTSYAATISEMCASPDNTIGFIPATAYVIGNDECGITVAMKSLRCGFTEYWAEAFRGRNPAEASIRMQQLQARMTFSHELGHSVGLRHNFAASLDRDNYADGYFRAVFGESDSDVDDLALPQLEGFDLDADGFLAGPEFDAYLQALREKRDERARLGTHNYTSSSLMDYNLSLIHI